MLIVVPCVLFALFFAGAAIYALRYDRTAFWKMAASCGFFSGIVILWLICV